MAELEAKLNVPATFFMMHRHKLNRKFYDDPSTWEALRHIQSLGHEIALHIDGFVLIEKYRDLSLGVCEERNKFADERLRVRGGNTHGNSFYQTKLNFEPMNFYREVIRPNYCTDASWNKHYGRYSLADLGFEFWADTAVWFSPDTLIIPDTFVSDNSTEWKMGLGLEPDWLMASAPYSLPAEFADEMLSHIRDANCIYLIHPQFYSS
jgi:hypothetical protein